MKISITCGLSKDSHLKKKKKKKILGGGGGGLAAPPPPPHRLIYRPIQMGFRVVLWCISWPHRLGWGHIIMLSNLNLETGKGEGCVANSGNANHSMRCFLVSFYLIFFSIR